MFRDDFLLNVSRGLVPGHSAVNKFGRNIEIDSGIVADVWDGGHTVASGGNSLLWVAPTAARIHTISSDNAADDVGGIGATTVDVHYLPDWGSPEQVERVSGDLDAGIAMENAAVIIHRMIVVVQATSTSMNVGTLIATAATDGTVTARINPGEGQTQMAIYGVPSTQDLLLYRVYGNLLKAGGAATQCDLVLKINSAPDTNLLSFKSNRTLALSTTGTSSAPFKPEIPIKIEGPAIIKLQGTSSANNVDVASGFDSILINKNI